MQHSNFRPSRLDAVDTAWFLRQLESIDETPYDELLPGLLGRRYIPAISNVDEWANVYTYRMFSKKGHAKPISRNADDLPRVTITGAEHSRTIKEIGLSYGWTVSEIQRAARNRVPLDTATVEAARAATDYQIDTMLAFGDADLGIEGLLDLSAVDTPLTPVAKTSGATWAANAATDPGKIIQDISAITMELFTKLKQADFGPNNAPPGFLKWCLLLPTDAYGAIATAPRSSTSDTTILEFVMRTNPWLESVEPWYHCDAAGGSSSGRVVAFPRRPEWGGALVPQDMTPLGPQERNLEIVVPTRASCGGVVCRYPVATEYMDGV